jgi:hypothetical protein
LGYLAVWKVLEETIADFRKKGLVIPAEVMNDLKSAKTMINILKADPNRGETLQKIEEYLANVESYLVSEGQKIFGAKYLEEVLKRLNEASQKISCEEEEETRFISGVPREEKWIRVKTSKELPAEKVKAIAEELNLSCNIQDDGYLLVYGKDDRIKEFVKKIANKHGLKT